MALADFFQTVIFKKRVVKKKKKIVAELVLVLTSFSSLLFAHLSIMLFTDYFTDETSCSLSL